MKRMAMVVFLSLAFAQSCTSPSNVCTKKCTTGKACGDTCIAVNDTCRAGAGTACNAN